MFGVTLGMICTFQEVDHFADLTSALKPAGYMGFKKERIALPENLFEKEGDGCSIFFKHDK